MLYDILDTFNHFCIVIFDKIIRNHPIIIHKKVAKA